MPMGGELDEELGELVLSLKTQLYLGIVQEDEETDKEAILSNIFPDDLGASLLRRHPEKELTLAESKFLTKLFQRHKFLQDNLVDADSIGNMKIIRSSWIRTNFNSRLFRRKCMGHLHPSTQQIHKQKLCINFTITNA